MNSHIRPDAKAVDIEGACRSGDSAKLVELATTHGGLLNDRLRQTAWPLLLGSKDLDRLATDEQAWKELPIHKDEDQVKLDVDRSFVYYPNNETEKQTDHRKEQLHDLIREVLRRHPFLSYFQGYHDILQVLLLVLGPNEAVMPARRLSLLYIRDFMLPTFTAATAHLKLIPAILKVEDSELEKHLSLTQPFFALSATITLYAHDIEEYGDIARLFDFLLAHEAIVSVYMFATIVLSRRKELMEIEPEEPEMLHATLSKLPKPLDLDAIITRSIELFRRHPPGSLKGREWERVSRYSVLKTNRTPLSILSQSLAEGKAWFFSHAKQIERQEKLWKIQASMWYYRRPALQVGVTILVGLLAIWLQRRGALGPSALNNTFQVFWSRLRSLWR